MPHFELAAAKREATAEPITFALRGERFTCAPSVPDWAGVELAAADENDPTAAAQALIRFILVALVPDDEERFRELVRRKWRPRRTVPIVPEIEATALIDGEEVAATVEDPDASGPERVVDEGWEPVVREELEALVGWLAEIYTGRPSMPLSSSPDGRRTSGDGLTAGSGSRATRPVRPDTDGGGS